MNCKRLIRSIFLSGLVLGAISPLFAQPIIKRTTRKAMVCEYRIGDKVLAADKLPDRFLDQLSDALDLNKTRWAKYSPESVTTFNGRPANEAEQIVKDWLGKTGITDADPTVCNLSKDHTYFSFQSKRNIEAKPEGLTQLPLNYDLSDLDLEQFAKDLGKAIGKTVVTKGEYSKDKFRLERSGKDNLSLRYLGEDNKKIISVYNQHENVLQWLQREYDQELIVTEIVSGKGTYYLKQMYWRRKKLSENAIQNHIAAFTGKAFSGSVSINESDNVKVAIRISYKDVTQLSPNHQTDTFRPIIEGDSLICESKLIKPGKTIPARFTNKNNKPWTYHIGVQNESK